MPEHIAAYAYGAKKDPVRAAGPSTMVRSIDVNLDSADYMVDIREMVEYVDSKGHHIVVIDNTDPDVRKRTIFPRKPLPPTTQPTPGKPLDIETVASHDTPLMFRTDTVLFHEKRKKHISLKKLDKFIDDFDPGYRDLLVATKVLGRMTRALREQLGMDV